MRLMSNQNHVSIVNSLRAIAALMVCFFHFTDHSDAHGSLFEDDSMIRSIGYYGHHGVNVFFVISGFVIPLSMYYGKYTLQSFGKFIGKRLLRLHPPFVASMLLYAMMEFIYAASGTYTVIYDWGRIISNFFLTARIFNYDWFQDVYWTLSIEFQYYLLIALIFPLIMSSRKWISTITLTALVGTCFLFGHDEKHYFFFHTPVFVLGIVVFLYHLKRINIYELLGYAMLCIWVAHEEISPACAVAAGLTAAGIAFIHFRSKALEWAGEISYSLYLTHGYAGCQLLYYTSQFALSWPQKIGLLTLAFAISLAFAYLFYRVFEIPSVRWSQKIKYNTPPKQGL